MRFIFVQPHLRYGGAERQTVLVANRLVRNGHDVTVILHARDGGLIGDLDGSVQILDLGDVRHAAIPLIVPRLRAALRSLPASFVIVKLWSSILATAAAEGAAPHHVYNYCEDLDPTDHAAYIRFGRIKQALIRRIFLRKELLSANTQTVADLMVAKYRLRFRPDVIPSTVDVASTWDRSVECDPFGRAEGIPALVSVGSLVERKGLRVTLAALLSVGRRVDWHIVGDGPLRQEFENFRDPSGNLRITVHGGTSNPYTYMRSADLLIHSASSEAWGIVLLESIAVGTPVIAANAIGPAEMLDVLGPRTGWLSLYERGDSTSLASLVLRWMEDGVSAPTSRPQSYLEPVALDTAVSMWIARADRELSLRRTSK